MPDQFPPPPVGDDDGPATPIGEGCPLLEGSLHEVYEAVMSYAEPEGGWTPQERAIARYMAASMVQFTFHAFGHLGQRHPLTDFHRWCDRVKEEVQFLLRAFTAGGLDVDASNTLGAAAAEVAYRGQFGPGAGMFYEPDKGFFVRELTEAEMELHRRGAATMRYGEDGKPVAVDAADPSQEVELPPAPPQLASPVDPPQSLPEKPLDDYLKMWSPPPRQSDKPN